MTKVTSLENGQDIERSPLVISKRYVSDVVLTNRWWHNKKLRMREVDITLKQGDREWKPGHTIPLATPIMEVETPSDKLDAMYRQDIDRDRRYILFPSHIVLKSRRDGVFCPRVAPFLVVPGSLMVLLHEYGHIHLNMGRSTQEQKERQSQAAILKWLPGIRPDLAEKYLISEERGATAFAIDQIMQLRKKDLDVEPGMPEERLQAIGNRAISRYAIVHCNEQSPFSGARIVTDDAWDGPVI